MAKFKVVLIEEGLGNFGDMFYYTREALESAESGNVFEGAKCYADHPDKLEERTRPERSVRDIIGHFESVHVEDGDQGQALLVGDLVTIDGEGYDWAAKMIEHATGFGQKFGKEFVGFSINASGDAEKNPLESFLKGGTIPQSAIPKLQSALARGIDEVEICTQLTEAVSCDLVTEAGAKGRTLKMLEGARLTMALKKTPKSAKESKAAPAKAAKVSKVTESEEAGNEQADADKDKEMIGGMLKKYVGGEDHDEAMHEAMKCALANAKEAGMEGEEAEKAAGYAVKLAQHAAAKQAKQAKEDGMESEEADGAEAKEADMESAEAEDAEDGDGDEDDSEKAPPKKKMESELIKLRGENAALAEKLAKRERAEMLEKAIKESGLPESAAKKFRESVKDKHTAEQISENLKLFKEAFGLAGQSMGDWFVQPENQNTTNESGGLSFADCVQE